MRKRTILPHKVEIAPLIDIIFILLIFFAVNTTIMINQQGLKLDLPQAASSEKNNESIVISIDKNEMIFIDKQPVSIDQLISYLEPVALSDPDKEVLINSDKTITYAVLINVLDKVRLSGLSKLSLQTEKKIIQEVE